MSVFARVADLGSFAAAAKELRLSPTMIGKHIRFLEERLGSQLINRSTRRQSLTELGRSYLDHCRHVPTVAAQTLILAAISLLLSPLDAASTMRARSARACGAPCLRVRAVQLALLHIIEYDRDSSPLGHSRLLV